MGTSMRLSSNQASTSDESPLGVSYSSTVFPARTVRYTVLSWQGWRLSGPEPEADLLVGQTDNASSALSRHQRQINTTCHGNVGRGGPVCRTAAQPSRRHIHRCKLDPVRERLRTNSTARPARHHSCALASRALSPPVPPLTTIVHARERKQQPSAPVTPTNLSSYRKTLPHNTQQPTAPT